METPYLRLAWAGQLLTVWLPMVLAACQQELTTLALGDVQKFPHTKESMYSSCAGLMGGQTEQCSAECDAKVQRMVDLYQGSPVFFTCDCSEPIPIYPEAECLEVQERLAVCPSLAGGRPTQPASPTAGPGPTAASTTPTLLQDGRVPCDSARRRCSQRPNCVSQLQATVSGCGGAGCDEACQRALDTLFAQRAAQDLWRCTGCDDDNEDGWCDLSRRCVAVQNEATLAPYKPEATVKPSDDDDTADGRAEKSVNPGNAAARSLLRVELLALPAVLLTAFL